MARKDTQNALRRRGVSDAVIENFSPAIQLLEMFQLLQLKN